MNESISALPGLALLAQATFDSVVLVDTAGLVRDLNPAAVALFEVVGTSAVGRPCSDVIALTDEAGDDTLPCPLAVVVHSGRPVHAERAWIRRPGGDVCAVRYRCVPIRDGDTVVGALGVFQDGSERARSAELLTRADRLASMGTMAASIAHEINNPLTYVLGNIEVVLSSTPGLPADAVDALRDSLIGARAIQRIVGDLKMLSAPDRTHQLAVDPVAVVQRSLRMVAKEVRSRGRLEAALSPALPVMADAVALGQVVINLVINAAQALGESYDEDSVVRVTTGHDGLYSSITVEDNGCGIPADVLERIFDPFFTTKALGEGSGLGLAVSHGIVKECGGVLQVESTVGVGTRMVVKLPAHTDVPSETDQDTITWSDRSYPRRRVMLVDDDPLVRRALASMLRRVHEVQTYSTVDEALSSIERGLGYDAILCDLMMSPQSGLELVDALPSIAPDLVDRTAFITGGVMSASVRERVVRTARPVAFKPFSVDEVLTLVESLALS